MLARSCAPPMICWLSSEWKQTGLLDESNLKSMSQNKSFPFVTSHLFWVVYHSEGKLTKTMMHIKLCLRIRWETAHRMRVLEGEHLVSEGNTSPIWDWSISIFRTEIQGWGPLCSWVKSEDVVKMDEECVDTFCLLLSSFLSSFLLFILSTKNCEKSTCTDFYAVL